MNKKIIFTRPLTAAAVLSAVGSACAQAPANDNFATAAPLTAGTVTAGNNTGATVEPGEPATHLQKTFAAGVATGKSVWYTYTPAANGLATFNVVAQGTGTTAVALQGAAYRGSALNALTRIASASSTAGAAGTPATAGAAFESNLFPVQAGVPVYFQVTGDSAAGVSPFNITVSNFARPGTVVLPRFSSWEWLHPLDGANPTTAATWAATWKIKGDPTAYGAAPAALKFTLDTPTAQPGLLGFDAFDGGPGVATSIGTPTSVAAGNTVNNAAYFRTTFTLPSDTSNLWAEIVADDGAYIYIDDLPGVPVHVVARLTAASVAANTVLDGYRPQAEAHLTGTVATGCRGYAPGGFNNERNVQRVFLGGRTGKLTAGSHRIAVSLHQASVTSSDLGFDLQLIDMGGWPLVTAPAGITFTDVPYTNASATATVTPIIEHHAAPNAGQTDLAWYCVTPDAAARHGAVISDTASGNQKALRLRDGESDRVVTEPINVSGLGQFVASVRVRTNDTSSGFEAADGFRIFLETSADGMTFAEPVPPLELQPQVNGAAALDPFKDGFVLKSLVVAPNTHQYARMVFTGGTDSDTEYVYLDDIRFGQSQVFTATSNVLYDNKGNNDRADDTVSFDLTVTGVGNTALTWSTTGFGAGSEVTGTINGPAVNIVRPAADATGARLNVAFTVAEDGNPATTVNVAVTTPAAAIGTIAVTNPVRNQGADPATTADDTFTYSVLVDGTATGSTYEIRSSETGNATLYGNGSYNAAGTLTLPASVTSITIRDSSVLTLLKAATVPPAGAELAMGRSVISGVSKIIYSNPAATALPSVWKQTFEPAVGVTPAPADLGLTVNETTTTLNAAAVIVAADVGVLESAAVDTTGLTGVAVYASLRAWEDSLTTGFEAADTFKIEIIETRAGGDTTVNLITGNPLDAFPANDVLNGYAGTTANYDANRAEDEFNASNATVALNTNGTFSFGHAVPADVLSIKVRVTAANDSANEFFFLQNLVVTNDTNVDSDGDTLPDIWENTHFGNLDQVAAGDPDGDGQGNAAEYAAGTLPRDGSSVLAITSATKAGFAVSVTFNSISGKKYMAESSTNLQTWANASASITAVGPTTTIPGISAGLPGRNYFRVKIVP